MENIEGIIFEITGEDYEKVKIFKEQHKDCMKGAEGERFEYSFIPSGSGVSKEIKCTCGQVLRLEKAHAPEVGSTDSYEKPMPSNDDLEYDEIQEQRDIGKLLLLVDIIHHENDRSKAGGFSFISRDDMMSWLSLDEQEMEVIMGLCYDLDINNMTSEVALLHAFTDRYKDKRCACSFMRHTYSAFAEKLLVEVDLDRLDEFYRTNAEDNYRAFCIGEGESPDEPSFGTVGVFRDVLQAFVSRCISMMEELLSGRLDWDVIVRMLRIDMSRGRFEALKTKFPLVGVEL